MAHHRATAELETMGAARRLSLDELDADAAAYDACVAATPWADQFCSSSTWILPAARALMPRRAPWIFQHDEGYLTLMLGTHAAGWSYLEPLEALWGLACPLIGADPEAARETLLELLHERSAGWDVLVLSGVLDEAPLREPLSNALARRYELITTSTTVRHVASLDGGFDGFMSRRSRNFRRSARRERRTAGSAGVEFQEFRAELTMHSDELFERILGVERRSWKGKEGVGIDVGDWSMFYRRMLKRLVESGSQRTVFARREGRDVAYVLGGVFEDTYRGLQISYDTDHAHHGLGNQCQLTQIEALCDEGVRSYDLGMAMPYKSRWAEHTVDSTVLLAMKR